MLHLNNVMTRCTILIDALRHNFLMKNISFEFFPLRCDASIREPILDYATAVT